MSWSDSVGTDSPMYSKGNLASRSFFSEGKKFYLDVVENQRGRFIKIAEISSDRRKNQIVMKFPTAEILSKNLEHFNQFYYELDKVDPDNLEEGELKSKVLFEEEKKYHMDLKENAKGRFLKVSETHGYSRYQVFIPAEGMAEFNANLCELIEEYDNGEFREEKHHNSSSFQLQNKQLRIEHKKFYFDIKSNQRGRFMSISEVTGNHRAAIFVPESGWESFQNIFEDQEEQLRVENKNFYFDIKTNQQGTYMSVSEVQGNFRNTISIPESGWKEFSNVLGDYVMQVK